MSRRKSNPDMSDMIDGIVQLWCPEHHDLGMVVVHPSNRNRFVIGQGVHRNGVVISEPDATKIKVRCTACEETGQHPDLQASWDRIKLLALGNLDDTTRRAKDITLGGHTGA